MACVRMRRGKWVIDYRDDVGKRHWETVGTSKRAAEEALAERIYELRKGGFSFSLSKQTVKDYSEKWIETYPRINNLKASTVRSYSQILRSHIVPPLGHLSLKDLRRDHIKEVIALLAGKDLSRSSIRAVIATLRAMLNTAVEDGILLANPAIRLGKFTKTAAERREDINPLTRAELGIFLRSLETKFPAHYPFFLTLGRTGMRLGEALALQWDDIDFNARLIEVRRSLVGGRVETPKSGKSRKVDMSLQLSAVLKDLLRARKEETLRKGWRELPSWVFCDQNGTPLDGNNLRKRVFQKALTEAKLRKFRIHDLRHTFATHLLQNKESPAYVQQQLGHHSIQVTVDIYGHLVPGGNKRAVDRLDDAEWKRAGAPAKLRGSKVVAEPGKTSAEPVQVVEKTGATRRTRTGDLLITNQLLYQLS